MFEETGVPLAIASDSPSDPSSPSSDSGSYESPPRSQRRTRSSRSRSKLNEDTVRSEPEKTPIKLNKDGSVPKKRGRKPGTKVKRKTNKSSIAADEESDYWPEGSGDEKRRRRGRRKGEKKGPYKKTAVFVSTDTGEPAVSCKTCGKQFPYGTEEEKKQFSDHRRVHSVERRQEKHSCTSCEYRAKSRADLAAHVSVVHEKQKPFKCDHCDKEFSSAATKSVHEKRVHADLVGFKLIICDCCGKGYTSQSAVST